MENFEEFRALIAEAYKQMSTDEAIERLRALDVPCAKSLTHEEALSQDQLVHNQSVEEVAHPTMGTIRQFRNPEVLVVKLSMSSPSPNHGEHTISVLKDMGFGEAELSDLQSNNVIS